MMAGSSDITPNNTNSQLPKPSNRHQSLSAKTVITDNKKVKATKDMDTGACDEDMFLNNRHNIKNSSFALVREKKRQNRKKKSKRRQ